MQAVFPYMSETPGRVETTGPELGQHTDDVLAELGKSAGEIEALRERGII